MRLCDAKRRKLGRFEAYVRRRGPYVLLRTQRRTVLLAPDDPERFVAEVSALLAGPAPPAV